MAFAYPIVASKGSNMMQQLLTHNSPVAYGNSLAFGEKESILDKIHCKSPFDTFAQCVNPNINSHTSAGNIVQNRPRFSVSFMSSLFWSGNRILSIISIYAFTVVCILPNVAFNNLSTRYNLINTGSCTPTAAFVLGCVAPFSIAWLLLHHASYNTVLSWIAHWVGLFANFIIPAVLYIIACDNNAKATSNQARLLGALDPKGDNRGADHSCRNTYRQGTLKGRRLSFRPAVVCNLYDDIRKQQNDESTRSKVTVQNRVDRMPVLTKAPEGISSGGAGGAQYNIKVREVQLALQDWLSSYAECNTNADDDVALLAKWSPGQQNSERRHSSESRKYDSSFTQGKLSTGKATPINDNDGNDTDGTEGEEWSGKKCPISFDRSISNNIGSAAINRTSKDNKLTDAAAEGAVGGLATKSGSLSGPKGVKKKSLRLLFDTQSDVVHEPKPFRIMSQSELFNESEEATTVIGEYLTEESPATTISSTVVEAADATIESTSPIPESNDQQIFNTLEPPQVFIRGHRKATAIRREKCIKPVVCTTETNVASGIEDKHSSKTLNMNDVAISDTTEIEHTKEFPIEYIPRAESNVIAFNTAEAIEGERCDDGNESDDNKFGFVKSRLHDMTKKIENCQVLRSSSAGVNNTCAKIALMRSKTLGALDQVVDTDATNLIQSLNCAKPKNGNDQLRDITEFREDDDTENETSLRYSLIAGYTGRRVNKSYSTHRCTVNTHDNPRVPYGTSLDVQKPLLRYHSSDEDDSRDISNLILNSNLDNYIETNYKSSQFDLHFSDDEDDEINHQASIRDSFEDSRKTISTYLVEENDSISRSSVTKAAVETRIAYAPVEDLVGTPQTNDAVSVNRTTSKIARSSSSSSTVDQTPQWAQSAPKLGLDCDRFDGKVDDEIIHGCGLRERTGIGSNVLETHTNDALNSLKVGPSDLSRSSSKCSSMASYGRWEGTSSYGNTGRVDVYTIDILRRNHILIAYIIILLLLFFTGISFVGQFYG